MSMRRQKLCQPLHMDLSGPCVVLCNIDVPLFENESSYVFLYVGALMDVVMTTPSGTSSLERAWARRSLVPEVEKTHLVPSLWKSPFPQEA